MDSLVPSVANNPPIDSRMISMDLCKVYKSLATFLQSLSKLIIFDKAI